MIWRAVAQSFCIYGTRPLARMSNSVSHLFTGYYNGASKSSPYESNSERKLLCYKILFASFLLLFFLFFVNEMKRRVWWFGSSITSFLLPAELPSSWTQRPTQKKNGRMMKKLWLVLLGEGKRKRNSICTGEEIENGQRNKRHWPATKNNESRTVRVSSPYRRHGSHNNIDRGDYF